MLAVFCVFSFLEKLVEGTVIEELISQADKWPEPFKSLWQYRLYGFLFCLVAGGLLFVFWDKLKAAIMGANNEDDNAVNREQEFLDEQIDGDMSEDELIAYAFENSACRTIRDIEIAIRGAALQKRNPVTVSIQPCCGANCDSKWFTVTQKLWKSYDIRLKRKENECGYIFRRVNPQGDSFGICPTFFRTEIESLWPKEKDRPNESA